MSGIVIEELGQDPSQVALWDRYVASHAAGTIYHLSAWRTIFEESFGYRSWLLMARHAQNAGIAGVLPLYLVASPFSRRLVSVPFRDRGGLLWDTPDAFHALMTECKKIAAAMGASCIRLKSLLPYPADQVSGLGLKESRYWVHSTVKLQGMTGDTLWQAIGDKNRNMVRQAQRQGLRCDPLDATAENLREWHRLHLMTQKRLGVPPFPHRFFATMAEWLHGTGDFALLGVCRNGALHAATILLLHRETAIYAYSASDAAGQDWRANDLMLWEVMRSLTERRIATFDMGSDSPLQESLLFFKRKWLAVQSPIPHYFIGDEAQTDSSDRKYALARKCFSLIPTPVLAAIGSAVTRYFG